MQLRPPWALDDFSFTENCTQCGSCVEVCPTGLIAHGHAGYPIVNFTNAECTFCGACKDACDAGCFDGEAGRPWTLKASISKVCVELKGVACRICQDTCEAGAIRFRPQLGGRYVPEISNGDCIGCGACIAPCPVSAVSIANQQITTSEVTP